MALTPVQEAQVLDLIAQQSALLSLAGVEATILSKLGATKVTLSDLPTASVIDDADLLLLRQGVTDKSVTGLTFKNLIPSTITTPPQFDNDTSIANTEFVQRALGNMQGQVGYNTSQAISTAQVGKLITFGASSLTLTLPLAANVPVGSTLTIYGNSFGGVVQRAGTEQIENGSAGSITSFTVNAHDKVTLVSIAGSGWYVIGGEVALKSSSSFGASLAGNGYQKLPSGLIIQLGTSGSVASAASVDVTLPIAFPNANVNVQTTNARTSLLSGVNDITGYALSLTQVRLFNNQGSGSTTIAWLAIGY